MPGTALDWIHKEDYPALASKLFEFKASMDTCTANWLPSFSDFVYIYLYLPHNLQLHGTTIYSSTSEYIIPTTVGPITNN